MIRVEIKTESTAKILDVAPEGGAYCVPRAQVPADAQLVTISFPFLDAQAGDEGYYISNSNKNCFLTFFTDRPDEEYVAEECILPFLAAKLGDRCLMVLVNGMRHDYVYHLSIRGGRYSLSITYDLTRIDLYEDIVLRVVELTGADADYSGVARAYRAITVREKGLTPLAERARDNAVLRYALDGMPLIRIRMGWKPVPTPVLEQTPETEPPMHVACTFAQVEALMEEMKRQGIEKAELSLVGWNMRGHDGRWPQVFPVEEALGGEEGLRRLIQHGKALGYRISCHTNSSDAYRIADCWDEGDIVKLKSGALSVDKASWSGGRMYHVCPTVALEKYLRPTLRKLRELGFEGFHYIDVLSILHPRTCFDPNHPSNAAQSAVTLNRLMAETAEAIGGFASEGGFDFTAKNLNYALYVAFNLLSGLPAVADEVVPLWQMVYSGYILSNPTAETVNYPIKAAENKLRFYEYGGMPTFYLYSRFVDTVGKNWMGEQDLYCATAAEREQTVACMRKALDEYRPFAQRRTAFMDAHRKRADGVYETIYSDGWHTVVNYTDADFPLDGRVVPAKDLIQFRG